MYQLTPEERWMTTSRKHIRTACCVPSLCYVVTGSLLLLGCFAPFIKGWLLLPLLFFGMFLLAMPAILYLDQIVPMKKWCDPVFVLHKTIEIEQATDNASIARAFSDNSFMRMVQMGVVKRSVYDQLHLDVARIVSHERKLKKFCKQFGGKTDDKCIYQSGQPGKKELDELFVKLQDESARLLAVYNSKRSLLLQDLPHPDVTAEFMI